MSRIRKGEHLTAAPVDFFAPRLHVGVADDGRPVVRITSDGESVVTIIGVSNILAVVREIEQAVTPFLAQYHADIVENAPNGVPRKTH